MENRTLADTTVWIEFFRGKSKVADLIEMLLTENAVCTCGVVMFELLQGIKSEGEKNKILSILATLPYFEMTQKLWRSAAEVSLSLKKHGVSLPLSDIFIATIAVENDLSIYTLDNHFTQIPNLKLHSF
ncbi:MAG: PIN domain-containing protein [Deltaproteobacteria bacterium]|nr:PIN domain-containing protein [Deltaproteobacteria bacterium]